MILPACALVAQGTQTHVASRPGGEPAVPVSVEALWPERDLRSPAFASPGACLVITSGALITPADVPEGFRVLAYDG